MNDDFDSRLYYNKAKIKSELKSLVSESGGLKPVDAVLSLESIPESFKQIIPNATEEFNRFKNLDKKEVDLISKSIIKKIENNIDSELDFLTDFIQQSVKFACFTPNIASNTMWGQYAESSSGFALEYIFDKQNIICSNKDHINSISCELYPMEYYQKRLDATDFAIYLLQVTILHKLSIEKGIDFSNELRNYIIPCPDNFMFTKVSLAKSVEWKREKEWRLFYFSKISELNSSPYSYVYLKPSALYLGRRISDFYQKILVDIAKEKGIPVYKMDFSDKSCGYNLRKEKLF